MLPIHALIEQECREISDLLIAKNKAYGNSFAEPINIFSKASAEEQINIRIDDKLNRIAKGSEKDSVPEDTEKDLIGYLVLKRVLRKINTPLVMVNSKLTEEEVLDYLWKVPSYAIGTPQDITINTASSHTYKTKGDV